MIRVAIVVRSRPLRATLERAVGDRAALVAVPLSAGGAQAELALIDADVVLMDLVTWRSGRRKRRGRPRTGESHVEGPAIIVLADAPDESLVAVTLREGAHGVLPCDAGVAELTAAMEAAAAGLSVMLSTRRPTAASLGEASLTEREREVLGLLAGGFPNRAIGLKLGISEQTVKTYVASIFEKLDAGTRAEAVAIGVRRGLIML